MFDTDDSPKVCLRIPVSEETLARLQNLSNACHADPISVAASLLHDLLKDDEDAEFLLMAPAASTAFN